MRRRFSTVRLAGEVKRYLYDLILQAVEECGEEDIDCLARKMVSISSIPMSISEALEVLDSFGYISKVSSFSRRSSVDFYAGVEAPPGSYATYTYLRDAPVVNLANANAALVLRAMGIDEDDIWDGDAIPVNEFIRLAMRALNSYKTKDIYREEEIYNEPGQAKMISFGYSNEDVMRRLEQLVNFGKWAADHGADVVYWG